MSHGQRELVSLLQTDPIGYGDGMNMYAYVGNDPVNGRDPSGMACTGTRLPNCEPPGYFGAAGSTTNGPAHGAGKNKEDGGGPTSSSVLGVHALGGGCATHGGCGAESAGTVAVSPGSSSAVDYGDEIVVTGTPTSFIFSTYFGDLRFIDIHSSSGRSLSFKSASGKPACGCMYGRSVRGSYTWNYLLTPDDALVSDAEGNQATPSNSLNDPETGENFYIYYGNGPLELGIDHGVVPDYLEGGLIYRNQAIYDIPLEGNTI